MTPFTLTRWMTPSWQFSMLRLYSILSWHKSRDKVSLRSLLNYIVNWKLIQISHNDLKSSLQFMSSEKLTRSTLIAGFVPDPLKMDINLFQFHYLLMKWIIQDKLCSPSQKWCFLNEILERRNAFNVVYLKAFTHD